MSTRREFLTASASLLGAAQIARAAGIAPASVPKANTAGLALFEPPTGCYIGAFIERDSHVKGSIPAFEEMTAKKHASYFTYVGYGRPFPQGWVNKIARSGGAPHIAFEPNDGLEYVIDSPYLRNWARDAARTKMPIFLRWASEMNGFWAVKKYGMKGPEQYREKFALVSKIMKEEAPNVAMVWTPFAKPTLNIDSFYPGDEWVDWVGMNIYSVFVHDGDPKRAAADEDPVDFLRFIYDSYATRKPVHISEFAATVECRGTGAQTVDFAIAKTRRFYSALRTDFPRVKSVNWFCLDTISTGLANNDYSLLSNGQMLATYRQLISDDHFLSQVYFNPGKWNRPVKAGTTVDAKALSYGDSSDEMLLDSAAVATTIDRPFLRGIKNGEIVSDDLQLRVQLPQGVEAHGVLWKVDGLTVALSNTRDMRRNIPFARFVEGPHTASVTVLTNVGEMHSDEVRFTIR
ncbi:hypothetical protein EON83_13955 [bacterium]|nr:MAG: hypothetical protein EON83_13955 [bacterium]